MTIVADSTVYAGRRFQGTVTSIDSRVDPVTRAVTVLATVPNDEGLLKPGMFLTVGLEKKRDDVLLIPEEALVPREGRQYVFVVEDGKAVEREVALGGRAPGPGRDPQRPRIRRAGDHRRHAAGPHRRRRAGRARQLTTRGAQSPWFYPTFPSAAPSSPGS